MTLLGHRIMIELLTIWGGAALQQGGVFFAVFRGGAALLMTKDGACPASDQQQKV